LDHAGHGPHDIMASGGIRIVPANRLIKDDVDNYE